jgi:DNA damage-inducible protein 1
LTLDLPTGLTVKDLKAFVEAETSFPTDAQHFFLNGQALNNEVQTLEDAGVKDGEMLAVLIRRRGNSAQGQAARPSPGTADGRRRAEPDPEGVRQRVVNNPAALANLRMQAPTLAAQAHDPARWREEFMKMARAEEEAARQRQNQLNMLNADPFNVEAQKQIEEMIRQELVMENVQHAIDHTPEGGRTFFHLC